MNSFTLFFLIALLISPSPVQAEGLLKTPPQAIEQKKAGNRAFESGHYEKAITHYTRAIDISPDYFIAYFNRGVSWYHLNFSYKAIVDFDRALELQPNEPEVLYFRGLMYEATGQFRDALADIQSAAHQGNEQAKKYLAQGTLTQESSSLAAKGAPLQSHEERRGSVRTTLRLNVYGGETITTIFSRGDSPYDGPDGIFKQVDHYSKKKVLRRIDTFHHALFSAKNNRTKSVSYFTETGRILRVEHHLSGPNLGKIELLRYEEEGVLPHREVVTLNQYQEMNLSME